LQEEQELKLTFYQVPRLISLSPCYPPCYPPARLQSQRKEGSVLNDVLSAPITIKPVAWFSFEDDWDETEGQTYHQADDLRYVHYVVLVLRYVHYVVLV
jgi:hypothetical protein